MSIALQGKVNRSCILYETKIFPPKIWENGGKTYAYWGWGAIWILAPRPVQTYTNINNTAKRLRPVRTGRIIFKCTAMYIGTYMLSSKVHSYHTTPNIFHMTVGFFMDKYCNAIVKSVYCQCHWARIERLFRVTVR